MARRRRLRDELALTIAALTGVGRSSGAPRTRSTRAIRVVGRTRESIRGAGVAWRSVGGEGDPWPAWLRQTRTACGVYAIRDRTSKRVLYVGSSQRKLYDTITRHMQKWGRSKTFFRGQYGRSSTSHDPGMTYERGRCEVMIKLVPCERRLDEETKAISRLRPRDNLVGDPSGRLEAAPF
jgi:hypothetical protein